MDIESIGKWRDASVTEPSHLNEMVVTNRASGCQVRVADCRLLIRRSAGLSTCAASRILSYCFALMMAFSVLRFKLALVGYAVRMKTAREE